MTAFKVPVFISQLAKKFQRLFHKILRQNLQNDFSPPNQTDGAKKHRISLPFKVLFQTANLVFWRELAG
jgi:hypothetical protein